MLTNNCCYIYFQVVLCFLTPRYVLSPLCTREMSLADVLRKPIVPIMLEATPWPPPGALALILSSLVYIDLCGKWNTSLTYLPLYLHIVLVPTFSSGVISSHHAKLLPIEITVTILGILSYLIQSPYSSSFNTILSMLFSANSRN